jgi:hypothetical protein
MGSARIYYFPQRTRAAAAPPQTPRALLCKGAALALCLLLQLAWIATLVEAARTATPFFAAAASLGF